MSARSQTFTEFDRVAMARALELAHRGLETTDPNPRVGCVVAQGEQIVGEGWHERPGEPHAEVMALRAAGGAAEGATAYVTLEPCSHHGRTPPCVDALLSARIGRVVFAVQDPNPHVNGQGEQALRKAGVVVQSGLLHDEAAELNLGFIKRMRVGRPWVRLKVAMSLDGRTALANGASQWITGEEARHDVQHWRARSSAVMTGIGTVLADDPQLNVRLPGRARQPLRVVVDTDLRTPSAARLLAVPGEVIIFTVASAGDDEDKRKRQHVLSQRKVRIECLPSPSGRVPLDAVLRKLAELHVNELLVECGPTLAGTLLEGGLVDEMLVYVAPVLLGPQGRALADLHTLQSLDEARRLVLVETQLVGQDLRLRLRPHAGQSERGS